MVSTPACSHDISLWRRERLPDRGERAQARARGDVLGGHLLVHHHAPRLHPPVWRVGLEMQHLPTRSSCHEESRVLEDAQVLHHAEARHLQLGLQLGQPAGVTQVELIEQKSTRGVGDCPEHAVVVGHVPNDM